MTTGLQIPRGNPRVQYVGDGTQKTFAYPFPIFAAADLEVWIDAAKQNAGFTVSGAGRTGGGSAVFALAPANGAAVTLLRRVPIERVTDFQESGPLSARSLNREFDVLTAGLQQTAGDQASMLRYADADLPASAVLPSRAARAGKLLAFDESGAPAARAPVDEEALSTYVPADGASRAIRDKLGDVASVKDFGAVGDGLTDDTIALQAALTHARAAYAPPGIYKISNTLTLGFGQTLYGAGQSTTIRGTSNAFDLIHVPDGYAALRDLRLEKGLAGVRLFGRDGACVQNALIDLTLWEQTYGLVLDGYNSTERPCYWNNIARVLVARPSVHGVWLTRSGAGDTPNANRFHMVRVYSLSAPMSGSGFYVECGRYNNAFIDCEANLHPGAAACARVGALTDKNLFVNFYAESLGGVPNIQLDAGSVETAVVNLFSAAAGPAIYDLSGGKYTAVNAGYPEKNRLDRTRIKELVVESMRYDTEYVEPAGGGTVDLDLTSSVYLVSAYGGATTVRLPAAGSANGHAVTIKKTDASANALTVAEIDGPGPDGRAIQLANRHDFITMVSNGAAWWIVAANVMPGNAFYHDAPGVFEPSLCQSLYMVSAWSGAVEARLPAPSAAHAAGRTLTIKKADQSGNAVTVTKSGGGGPDNEAIALTAFGHAVTVMSNGAGWHIIGRNP